jgi:predicted 2-oxoglutarate/Fe(II)-dependent dioxygenase YbiX
MLTRSMTVEFLRIMGQFHDSPLGAVGADMEALFAQLLAFLQRTPGMFLTLSQCKVVVRHGDASVPIVHAEVHRILMDEFKLHYQGDDEDYLGGPICMHENLRE